MTPVMTMRHGPFACKLPGVAAGHGAALTVQPHSLALQNITRLASKSRCSSQRILVFRCCFWKLTESCSQASFARHQG